MKFAIIAVAFLFVISGVKSYVLTGPALGLGLNGLGLGLNPLGLTSVGLGLNGLALGLGGINGLGLNNLGLLNALGFGHRADLSGLGVAVGVPGQSLSQGPAILGASGVDLTGHGILGHGATYVAKNRGAIHTAPLEGHINSAASVNIAPAPGTFY